MALPFLNRKKNEAGIASTIMEERSGTQPEEQEDKGYDLEDCAKDIIAAIHQDDPKALAFALQEAFEKLEKMPHEEGEHVSPHTYEAQNQAAGEE